MLLFESIVYNRVIAYKRQSFRKAVVHVIITDQFNQNRAFDEIIFSHAILVTVTSECSVKRIIFKTWIGTLANRADLYVWSEFALFAYIFPAYTQRQNPPVLSLLWLTIWQTVHTAIQLDILTSDLALFLFLKSRLHLLQYIVTNVCSNIIMELQNEKCIPHTVADYVYFQILFPSFIIGKVCLSK